MPTPNKEVIQKLTMKSFAPNVIKNVNLEAMGLNISSLNSPQSPLGNDHVPGEKKFPMGDTIAMNISTNIILDAITPRPGVQQADINQCFYPTATTPIPNTTYYQQEPTVFIDTYPFDVTVDHNPNYGVIFKSPAAMVLTSVTFKVKNTDGFSYNTLGVYEFDKINNTTGAYLATGSTTISGNPTDYALSTVSLTTPLSLMAGKWYLFILRSPNVTTIANQLIYGGNPVTTSAYGCKVVPVATTLTQFTPQATVPVFYLNGYGFSNVPLTEIITGISDSLTVNETLITTINPVPSFDNGQLRAITHVPLDTNAPIVESVTDPVFPGAYYGGRFEQSVHSFMAMHGGQLDGRCTKNDLTLTIPTTVMGTPKLNLTPQYPMYKRAQGDTKWVKCDSDVTYNGKAISLFYDSLHMGNVTQTTNFTFTQTAVVNDKHTYTATFNSPYGTLTYPNMVEYPTTSGVATGGNKGDTRGLVYGTYEYAFEFIDRMGMVYSTCSAVPAAPINGAQTICPVDMTGYPTVNPTYDSNSHVYTSAGAPNYSNQYGVAGAIPVPDGPYNTAADYITINVYRRYTYQKWTTEGAEAQGGGISNSQYPWTTSTAGVQADYQFVMALGKTNFNASWNRWEFIDTIPDRLLATQVLNLKTYYVPAASDIALFQGGLVAIGDATYPNYIFCGRDYITDFWLNDAQQVSFPSNDAYFTGMKQLKDALYVFSSNGTWEVRRTSTIAPYFTIRPVSTQFGCISTSQALVVVGDSMLIPTKSGLCMFDGKDFKPVDNTLNRIFNGIETGQLHQLTQGSPNISVGTTDSFNVTGTYDPVLREVTYVIPNGTTSDVYVLNLTNGNWVNAYFPNIRGVSRLKQQPVYWDTNKNVYILNVTDRDDYFSSMGAGQATVIPLELKTVPIAFGEKSKILSFRAWGSGTITLNLYFDKENTPTVSHIYTLDENGSELRLGWMARYLTVDIQSSDPLLVIKGMELLVSNSGEKLFENSVS